MTKSITRRILAICVAIPVTGTLVFLAIATGNEIALGALIAEGTLVLGFYFGTKAAQI